MKIRRRRGGGVTVAIAGNELQQMLGDGAELMKLDSNGVILEITNRIHYELTQYLFPSARAESDPIFTPPPKGG